MSEQSEEQQVVEQQDAAGTGLESVDTVVASLDALDDLPVAEHVTVFERAHESLRQALSEA